MRIGVLGPGRVGSGLAAFWTAKGHDVRTRARDTVGETAAFGDVVLLAVPGGAAADVLASLGTLAGKVVVDATNFGPGAAALAAQGPDARVGKAFNTGFAA